jgi:hypothetical protein
MAGLTPETALARARKNLEELMKDRKLQAMNGPDGEVAMVIVEGFPHAAATLALETLHALLSQHLGEVFYACIPTVDHLVAFRRKPRQLVSMVVAKAREIHEESPFAVTDKIFKVEANRVVPVKLGKAE